MLSFPHVMDFRIDLKVRGARGHLHFFRKMIQRPDREIPPGSIVAVFDKSGAYVGRGFYNPHSQIAVRILTFDDVSVDAAFLRERLQQALTLRHDFLRLPEQTTAYRLCNSEGDGLSGLIIDRYDRLLVVEIFSRGFFEQRSGLGTILHDLMPECEVTFRADKDIQQKEEFTLPPPTSRRVTVQEHGARFWVDGAGHKTGFFCDQRDNRTTFAALARGQILDLCCYTGGFAIHGSLQKASVTAVDLDETALALARENARLNRVTPRFVHADLFNYLRQYRGDPFDAVVIDPPKLAHTSEDLEQARRTYRDMNILAMKALKPGGLLLSCSCSGLVSESDFLEILLAAAQHARRELRIFRIAGAAPDHPISSLYPEGRYLKAVYSTVH